MKTIRVVFGLVALIGLSAAHAQSINVTSTGVGIGTATPTGKLDVTGAGGLVVAGTNLDPSVGYALSPLQNSGKLLVGWNRTSGGGEIDFISNRKGGEAGGFLFYDYTNTGVLNPLFRAAGNGEFRVNGTVRSRGFITDPGAWADYVFDKKFKLSSLNEIEQHIEKKGHLPGIPAEKEILETGVNLGDMQIKLLVQIEQLMLHVIALNKQVQAQAKRIAELEATRSAK